jgi:hypothetical protein
MILNHNTRIEISIGQGLHVLDKVARLGLNFSAGLWRDFLQAGVASCSPISAAAIKVLRPS